MADRKKKSKNRREEDDQVDPDFSSSDDDKPTKEECAVAKHLRFGLEVKEAKLAGMTVKYFIASEAINKLMESKWATNKNKQDNLFTSRQSCVHYLDRLLNKGMFHRALKVERKRKGEEEEKKGKKKESELEESQDERKLRRRKKEKEPKEIKEKESEKEETEKEEKKEEKSDDKKKKEKKVKLRMHDEQIFLDGEQFYVWIYDPVNVKTFIIGLLMVLGSIALCLFPLWPPIVRQGVYYLSLAGAAFVGFIIVLAVFRFIPFCLIWLFTGGKHHFWMLPNLTEDVGFVDSFRPLYTHTIVNGDKKKKDSKPTDGSSSEKSEKISEKKEEKASDKESESSDNEGYEMVDKSEVTDTDQ